MPVRKLALTDLVYQIGQGQSLTAFWASAQLSSMPRSLSRLAEEADNYGQPRINM
jgi:hypothetical protein